MFASLSSIFSAFLKDPPPQQEAVITNTDSDPLDDPQAFIDNNGEFQLKIRFASDASGRCHRLNFGKFKTISFEVLLDAIKAIPGDIPLGTHDEMSVDYVDCHGHTVYIYSTEIYGLALKESRKQGFLLLTVSKKPDPLAAAQVEPQGTPPDKATVENGLTGMLPPVPVTPPTVAAASVPLRKRKNANSVASGATKKKKKARAAPKAANVGIIPIGQLSAAFDAPPQQTTGIALVPVKEDSVHYKILTALLELRALGIGAAPRLNVALMSGYINPESAGFKKAVSFLSKEGYVVMPSGMRALALSPPAVAMLPSKAPPPTNEAMHDRLRGILTKGKGGTSKIIDIFDTLTNGAVHTKIAVGLLTNYTNCESAGFKKSLSQLARYGVLQYPTTGKHGTLQLTDLCFPYGRPGDAAVPPSVATRPALPDTPGSISGGEALAPADSATIPVASVASVASMPDTFASSGAEATAASTLIEKDEVAAKIGECLCIWHALGVSPLPKKYLVLYSGYANETSTGFVRAFGKLRRGEYLTHANGMVQVTDLALRTLPKVKAPTDNASVHTIICEMLEQSKNKGKSVSMFQNLSDGKAQNRVDLMKGMGYNCKGSTGFAMAISQLSGLKLIEYPKQGEKGTVQLTDVCFPFGRPN